MEERGKPAQQTQEPACEGFASVDELLDSRHQDYGHPTVNLPCIADLWGIYWDRRIASQGAYDGFTATDVCVFNILQKISRIANNPEKIDSWDDIQGYAECAKKCMAAKE